MTAIQLILFFGLLLISIYAYRKFRNSIVDAVVMSLFILAGIALVIFPEVTSWLAHALGVGRGVDLIFYFGILFFIFIILKLYARIRRLEQLMTKVIRNDSIAGAVKMSEKNAMDKENNSK
jgi:hypothetical protein